MKPSIKDAIQTLHSTRNQWKNLKSNHNIELEYNYVIWSLMEGLGNIMLSLASTFLYALLTNKVLLVHQTDDLVDLFCEPFPGSTWILPSDFPIKDLNKFNLRSQQSYGNMLGKNLINYDIKALVMALPALVYIHLRHDYKTHLDRLFFCEDDQLVLKKVNWLASSIYDSTTRR
ncbi:probable fucosyltransferase 8 [Typha latifolia]|uniref:probable fucosyltransferase 8 n=1 Tax=Typha latifolia TaxID=4733 RepID=UPI003C2F71E3